MSPYRSGAHASSPSRITSVYCLPRHTVPTCCISGLSYYSYYCYYSVFAGVFTNTSVYLWCGNRERDTRVDRVNEVRSVFPPTPQDQQNRSNDAIPKGRGEPGDAGRNTNYPPPGASRTAESLCRKFGPTQLTKIKTRARYPIPILDSDSIFILPLAVPSKITAMRITSSFMVAVAP